MYQDDEKWMKSFDIPKLHLIFDGYTKAAKKTWWLGKLGRTLRSRILRSILTHQIKRYSNSSTGDLHDIINDLRLNRFIHVTF